MGRLICMERGGVKQEEKFQCQQWEHRQENCSKHFCWQHLVQRRGERRVPESSLRLSWKESWASEGLACLLNTFPVGEISNAKLLLVQLMEWPFQKLLHVSSLWVLGLKYKFKRAGCRRGVCHFFWYFVSSSLLWSLQQCSSDNL